MTRDSTHRYPRTARVNEVVVEVIAEELERLSDPRLELVTITGADVATDLRTATVYYSALDGAGGAQDEERAKATLKALRAATPHLRNNLGKQVRWRHVPSLNFKLDPSIAHGQRIEEILRELHAHDEEDA